MFLLKNILGLAIAAVIFSTTVFAQNYKIETGASVLKWTGEKILGKHWGTVKIKSGTVNMANNKMNGEFVIDMTSIVSDDLKDDKATHDKLVGHLKSDDFFSVAKHNNATFKLKKADPYNPKKGENYNYMVTGDLTIKGITHEIRFPANIDIKDGNMTALAEFTIDRSKWDVRFGSGSFFDNLGDKAIYDDIKFELTLKGKAN